jgi:hypothetical protein
VVIDTADPAPLPWTSTAAVARYRRSVARYYMARYRSLLSGYFGWNLIPPSNLMTSAFM